MQSIIACPTAAATHDRAPMGRHISYYGADGTAPECDAWRAVGVDLDFEACILCDVRVPRHDDLRAAVVVHDQTD